MSRTSLLGTPIGSPVLEEVAGHIQAFFEQHITDEGSNYEVEAKFGRLVDRSTGCRISLPVLSTCVLAPSDRFRFEAELSMNQHRTLNQVLNAMVAQANQQRWRYRHEKTVDSIYVGPRKSKIRLSRDSQSGHILGAIDKRRIADMSLHIPAAPVDVRISINTETRLPPPEPATLEGWTKESERYKDRVSYAFERTFQVDLTLVKQLTETRGNETKHELEIEILDISQRMAELPSLSLAFLANILDIARSTPG